MFGKFSLVFMCWKYFVEFFFSIWRRTKQNVKPYVIGVRKP